MNTEDTRPYCCQTFETGRCPTCIEEERLEKLATKPEPPEPWEVLGFRRFTKVDWYGLAGAEPFFDGSDPLVLYGEPEVQPEDADVGWTFVLDQTGLHAEQTTCSKVDDPFQMVDEGVWLGEDGEIYDVRDFLKSWAASGKPLTFDAVAQAKGASLY